MELKSYQRTDQSVLDEFGGKGILAYDMGMGKTATSITYVKDRGLFPCIIVCPPSAFNVFPGELVKWVNHGKLVTINNGNSCKIPIHNDMFVLITYDMLSKWIDELTAINPKFIIFDEAHKFSNVKSKRNMYVRKLCECTNNVLFLTGSVFANKVEEMFTMLNVLDPATFPDVETITEMHNDGTLFLILQKYMIRRLKEDYLNLPEKNRSVVYTSITNMDEYKRAEEDFIEWLLNNACVIQDVRIHAFTKLEKLKQIALKGKMQAIEHQVQAAIQRSNKTLVFFTHTKPLLYFREKFPDVSDMIKGGMTRGRRLKAEKNIMVNDKVRVLFANIRAAGESLTLTTADTVIFAELPWTALACDQAEDRAHRIGQKSNVKALYLVARGTVEERILRIINRKRKVASETLDGKKPVEMEVISELLNEYGGGYVQ